MDGYSEIGAIYYSIADKTAFAKFDRGDYADSEPRTITGSYIGAPPYRVIKGTLPKLLRQFHAAEHQVLNCFMQKIQDLPADTELKQFIRFIPNLEETKKTGSFSMFCGTTFFLGSGLLVLLAAVPNLLKFHNLELGFMSIWFAASILITLSIIKIIQKKFFLAEAKDEQLILAIEALKEVLKDE